MKDAVIASSVKTQCISGIRKAMEKKGVSQSELARRMLTSRAVVHRLLKADDTGLTLQTISKAASALGLQVYVKFVA